jgi:phenylalanyl-tRNA synthetase beta chain
MKVSLNWLRNYVNITVPLKELADKLTMAGAEVTNIETVGGGWDKIVIGQIAAVEPHPNADRLKLATVDLDGERHTVVCGAPDVKVGDKVPFARVGAQLIDAHTGQLVQLKPAKIRGLVSEGMACSEMELGISDNHEGLMILPPEAPLGVPLADYLGDSIFELDVTPNRSDCLSVIGIAREIAALIKGEIHLVQPDYEGMGEDITQFVTVEIAAPDLCGRYCASLVNNIKIAPSPQWMQQRLLACGMRPINNIVDITNYVMLEYGQPLHSFDYEQLGGGKIIVRRARNGETMTTLDGMRRTLNSNILVIGDAEFPVAIAGVMGGVDSEVTEITRSILLESANFNPISIRHTSTDLKLRSEASLRFERGISPELTLLALKRATQLLIELAGGKAANGIVDVYPGKTKREPILLPVSEVKRLLGMEIGLEQISEVLTSLGFECQSIKPSELLVTVPYWRTDVSMVADLIEEVARIIGYDYIPTTMLGSPLPQQQPNPSQVLRERTRDILVECGFQEVISYSLISKERLSKISLYPQPVDPLRVANPMSKEQEYLRTSLRPSLLNFLSSNQKHEQEGIRLFEIGKVYLPKEGDLPEEREMLMGVLSGPRAKHSWLGEKGEFNFFDAKGVVEALLERLGIEAGFAVEIEESLHPGRAARIAVADDVIGRGVAPQAGGELRASPTASRPLRDRGWKAAALCRTGEI